MSLIRLSNGSEFKIEFGAPISFTENIVFLVKVLDSDIDTVHNAFKNPTNTESIGLVIGSDDGPETVYTGYTRYCGFSVDTDGGIKVTLKRS